MATEYVPALPEGYVYSLAKARNLLTGWGQGLPTLVLDEKTMTWRRIDSPATAEPLQPHGA